MPTSDLSRRAVVTGMGAVTPIGNDAETFWSNLLAGVSGGGPITTFDTTALRREDRGRGQGLRPAGDDGPQDGPAHEPVHPLRRRGRRSRPSTAPGIDFESMSRSSATGRGRRSTPAAAASSRSSTAPTRSATRAPARSARSRSRRCRASMAAAQVSMKYGLTGPVITQVAACASGVIAYQDALRLIALGRVRRRARRRLGGAAARRWPSRRSSNMTALSKRNDDPAGASRPVRPDPRRLRLRRGRRA